MNKKRLLTVSLALGVAFLMVSIPYTQNADAIDDAIVKAAVIISAAGGSLLAGLGIGWIAFHKESNDAQHPEYTTDLNAYGEFWGNEFEYITNMLSKDDATALDMINVLNNTKLFFIRAGEYEAMNWLNKTSWDTEVQDAVLTPFDSYIYNMTLTMLQPYLYDYKELLEEYVDTENTAEHLIEGGLDASGTYYRLTYGDYDNNLTFMALVFADSIPYPNNIEFRKNLESFGDGTYNQTLYKKVYEDGNFYIFFENTTDILDLTDAKPILVYRLQRYNSTGGLVADNCVYQVLNQGTSSGFTGVHYVKSDNTDYSITCKYYMRSGVSLYKEWCSINAKWISTFNSVYSSIRNAILTNANAIWQSYKDAGYGDKSDIPEDEQIIFPDIALDNADSIFDNLSYNDTFPFWASIMEQLGNSDLLNNSHVDWGNFTIANYSGKYFNIILTKYADSTNISNNTVLINGEKCYIIPRNDLTLTKNKTYLVSTTTTFGNDFDNINYDVLINQDLLIYSLDSSKSYHLYANSNIVYTIQIHNAYENGTEVDSIPIDVLNAGKFYFPDLYNNESIPLPIFPITNNDDNSSWLNYKILVVGGLFVVGIVLSGDRQTKTLSKLLIIASLGLGFYWYIYPHFMSALNSIDKLIFWR